MLQVHYQYLRLYWTLSAIHVWIFLLLAWPAICCNHTTVSLCSVLLDLQFSLNPINQKSEPVWISLSMLLQVYCNLDDSLPNDGQLNILDHTWYDVFVSSNFTGVYSLFAGQRYPLVLQWHDLRPVPAQGLEPWGCWDWTVWQGQRMAHIQAPRHGRSCRWYLIVKLSTRLSSAWLGHTIGNLWSNQ